MACKKWSALSLPAKIGIVIGSLVGIALLVGIVVWACGFKNGSKPNGAVVTNGFDCANIGANILSQGGKAVDAAIAALFCEGLKVPQSAGLGGGFFMTIYDAEKKKAIHLDSRETAAKASTQDMFHGDAAKAKKGILSVAVPAELRGYHEAYKLYGGGVPWRKLVQPSIDLLEEGIVVTKYMANVLSSHEADILKDKGLRSVFCHPETLKPYVEGDRYKNPALQKTLKIIAEEGGLAMHGGPLTKLIIDEMNTHKTDDNEPNIITMEDLKTYTPRLEDATVIDLPNGRKLYSSPLPGSGVILSYILNIIKGKIDSSDDPVSVVTQQRIIESFKFGYGQRFELGDSDDEVMKTLVKKILSEELAEESRSKIKDDYTSQDPTDYGFVNGTQIEDHGTAHISIIAPNGDAVSVTSTINLVFGAGILLTETGIILNDEMDDFASPGIINDNDIPASPANFIEPGRRPLSSMCPSIIVGSDGEVEMIIGGAGGTKITTAVALSILRHFTFDYSIKKAINEPRVHHQLLPMELELEGSFYDDKSLTYLVDGLCDEIKHTCTKTSQTGFSAVTGITINKDTKEIEAAFDDRRQGEIAIVTVSDY